MSMDAALSRFPECPSCCQGVDENAAEEPYEIIRGDHWHSRCAREAETFDLMYQRLRRSLAVTTTRGLHDPHITERLILWDGIKESQ